ncbi:penicillin-insensitive murein endopeptidase [Enhygromyxa salina]|uniref:Transcriptional regulatory protein EmbR n=1 Tax=Enhygromyxa salina TaxID=215803 RepID=A0A2S9YA51_9BACT|nr:penicillin-insensitive murein endopeptidase [Enhygromyxa salina]PRQ01990.1 Transcriptional regulatory protein EmbR [Enhygromyxa salina]
MQGRIRITGPDGRSWHVPFTGAQLSIGRTADNDLVLEQGGVSSRHCVIGRDPTGVFVIQDQGSTNGTWLAEQRVQGTVALQPGMKVTVGSYILELEAGAVGGAALGAARPATGAGPIVTAPIGVRARGPLIRGSADERAERRFLDRVTRYAAEWDKSGRRSRLLLRGRNLRQAIEFMDRGADLDESFGELEESFIRASIEGRDRNKVVRIAGVAGGALLLIGAVTSIATHDWSSDEVAVDTDESKTPDEPDDDGGSIEIMKPLEPDGDGAARVEKTTIEHVVIPAETLEEIALRYSVSLNAVMRWNGIDESTPLEPGRILEIQTDKVPLPQQQLTYRTDKRESWSSLAKRFDVPVSKLQAYNPDVGDSIKVGAELTVWVDPKPLRRKDVQIPEFVVRPDAISVGAPQSGKILNAINFPENDSLYKRRNPQIMWCGSHMAQHLQHAIASFRFTYEFEGEIVVADMSKQHGGLFNPHKSHQAGRDVDIWLPSLKGVYQPSHIREGHERRPTSEEADWFALYGFLKALYETREVEAVFLAYELHDRVYKAAKLMGASDEELDAMIAYPRGAHHRKSLLQHSAGHTHHVHVRFKCGPNDECSKGGADFDPGD